MCVTKVCCCGCTLRHGAITAVVFKAIEAVILIAMGILFIVDYIMIYVHLYKYRIVPDPDKAIIGGVVLSLGLIFLVIFICLVVGIRKNKAGFVMPWLIGCMFDIVIWCILITLAVVFWRDFWPFAILLYVAFDIFLWIVVLNYYSELRDSPPPYNPEIKA